MIYSILANLTIIVHLLFILFVLFGGLLVFWKKWLMPFHLLALAWGMGIEFFGWGCPLTPLENHFSMLAGEEGYSGGFIEHYIVPIIYPTVLNTKIQFALGFLVLLINILIYGFYVYRSHKK